MGKPLTVYKASAGSGKTFRLAVEFIKLLIENPQNYRRILAVTFTKKATEEMKMRILSQLYGIWKNLSDSSDYVDRVCEELSLPLEVVSKRAGEAIRQLLHNYSYFRVETIDSFFQSVLRNLARELELTANLKVELNDVQVEQQAVDELIESLDEHSDLLRWILDYIQDNISEDKGWNVIGSIKRFGEHIFKDYYKENGDRLRECFGKKGFFRQFNNEMLEIRQQAQQTMTEVAARFFETLEAYGIAVEDFSNGANGVCGYFLKLRDGKMDESLLGKRVSEAMEDPLKWVRKKDATPDNPAFRAVSETLLEQLVEAEKKRKRCYCQAQSATITMRHLNQLRLLGNIEQKVRELNNEANRFLLSDTQSLLHSLIEGTDSPFIFEKIGTQLDHVMIDEFQDTSIIQWKNFKVLLEECMSRKKAHNILVGDVKQSIYRWRSGDWRLLNDIQTQFTQVEERLSIEPLKTNYRSQRNIINFNNAFFTMAPDIEYNLLLEDDPQGADSYRHAYEDVWQEVPDRMGDAGYVSIALLPKEDYVEETFRRMQETVNGLISRGVPFCQIAVIVRSNRTIQAIAEWFSTNMPEVRLVSNEAFRLDASLAVNTLITALRFLAHPDDKISRETLVMTGLKLNGCEPKEFFEQAEKLVAMTLFDMVESIFNLFRLKEIPNESAYVCAFYDQLSNYITDSSGDIDALLTEWDNTLCGKTVQSNEVDGIRLLTIHKSKGLEFDHVIMPFCDWTLEFNNTIWCLPTTSPFIELPLVPVDYSKKNMKGTIYEADYRCEHLQNMVDNMNLLYVAFTRAKTGLYVTGLRSTPASRSYIIEQALPAVSVKLGNDQQLQGIGADNKQTICFEYGDFETSLKTSRSTDDGLQDSITQNVFRHQPVVIQTSMDSFPQLTKFLQSNKSRDFIEGDEIDVAQTTYIKIGCVLHQLFSTIRTSSDLDQAIWQLELEGVLYDNNITADKLRTMLLKRLSTPLVADWFSGRWEIFNECSILHTDPETGAAREHRPDRVMTDGKETIVVDFKFGKSKPEYREQVALYMDLLRQMGAPSVKGYVWYVYSNVIEKI